MKAILTIPFITLVISCSSVKQAEETRVPEYQVELKMKEIIFYGDTISFETPLLIQPTPNSDKITLIELGNGNRFGVKYFMSTMTTGQKIELVHNAVFYEEVIDEWKSLDRPDHREKMVLGEEKNWGLSVGNGEEFYLKADFTYLVKEV